MSTVMMPPGRSTQRPAAVMARTCVRYIAPWASETLSSVSSKSVSVAAPDALTRPAQTGPVAPQSEHIPARPPKDAWPSAQARQTRGTTANSGADL